MRVHTLYIGFCLLLGACAKDLQNRVDNRIASDVSAMKTQRIQIEKEVSEPAVVRHESQPTANLTRAYFTLPTWADEKLDLKSAVELPLKYFLLDVVDGRGKRVSYEHGVDQNRLIAIDYQGTIKGLFATIAGKLDYAYEITEDEVIFRAFVTRTFEVAMFPGEMAHRLGSVENSSSQNTNAADGAGASSFSATSPGNTGEYANISGRMNIWSDLRENIESLLSEEGSYFVSESTSSITVKDRPSQLRIIETLVNNINRIVTRQVILDIQLVDITLSDANKMGVDWSLVRQTVNSAFRLTNEPGAIFFDAEGAGSSLAFTRLGNSSLGTTHFLVQALREQGKVSVETTPRIIALNNRPAEIRMNGSTFFIQRTAINSVADAGVTTEAEQGVIVTGFSLYLLPRITDEKVVLHLSNNVTDLIQIRTQSVGTTQIESPEFVEKVTNGSTVLKDGETLMLSGFRSFRNRRDDAHTFGLIPSGQQLESNYTESILLITARIMG